MPSGTLCPGCGKPVMTYRRFFREAEPYRTSRCSHCAVELKRNKSVWLLMVAGIAVALPIVRLGVPIVYARWGAGVLVAAALVFVGVWTMALNMCGWLFVGWRLAATPR